MSFIADLQEAVAGRLLTMQQTEEGLQALEVTTEVKGSIDSRIAQRLAQACAGVVVSTPAWQAGETPQEIIVEVALVLVENVIANRGQRGTRKTATEIAEQMFAYLHGWQPTDESWTPLQFTGFATRDADDSDQILYHVMSFRTTTLTRISDQ